MSAISQLSDQELAVLLKAGNYGAFTEIYGRYKAVLYLHAQRLLSDRDEAKDVVQDIFIMLWERREELVFNRSVKSYLYNAVRNRIFNIIWHKKFENRYVESLQKIIDAGAMVTDEAVREKELAALIEQEIEKLPEKMREVFRLSRKEHLSYKEIAAELQIGETTVKKQVSNALKILRLKLKLVMLVLPF